MFHLSRFFAFLAIAAIGGAAPTAASAAAITDIVPDGVVVAYAKAHDIPLAGFELAGAGEPSRPGDRLTALFTIQEGGTSRQWLAEFRAAALTAREANSKPGSGFGILSIFVSKLHTDTGHTFTFPQAPAALEIRTYGPFSAGTPSTAVTVTDARVMATREYLVQGLAPMAEIELQLRAKGKKNPGISYMIKSGFSEQQMAATKARAQDAGFTEDNERTYAQSIFALVQFAHLAFETDGVDAIVREIADSPTLFSGAFVNFDWPEVRLEDNRAWAIGDAPVYRMPYDFISKTKARGAFYVVDSRPPLQNMAGIVGLTIDSTSKTPTKRLLVRVLASRLGAATGQ